EGEDRVEVRVIIALGVDEGVGFGGPAEVDVIPTLGEVDRRQFSTGGGKLDPLGRERQDEGLNDPLQHVEPLLGFGFADLVEQDDVRATDLAKSERAEPNSEGVEVGIGAGE